MSQISIYPRWYSPCYTVGLRLQGGHGCGIYQLDIVIEMILETVVALDGLIKDTLSLVVLFTFWERVHSRQFIKKKKEINVILINYYIKKYFRRRALQGCSPTRSLGAAENAVHGDSVQL